MSKKKSKVKRATLRQRLRQQSAGRLDVLTADVKTAVEDTLKSAGTEINPYDVMRLLSGGQTKTLREQLITDLSNEVENELEALYNKQLGLLPGDTHVVEA